MPIDRVPHGDGDSPKNNGPRVDAPHVPAGPRKITLKAATPEHRTNRARAEREIRARENANYTKLHSDGTEKGHAEVQRAFGRAKAEHEINERFRRAKPAGG